MKWTFVRMDKLFGNLLSDLERYMRILAICRRRTEAFTDEQLSAVLDSEAERVRELYAEGVFRWVASRGDMKGAVVELECADLGEAKRILDTLPFVKKGMLEVQVIPLLPYRGFVPPVG